MYQYQIIPFAPVVVIGFKDCQGHYPTKVGKVLSELVDKMPKAQT